jgi:glutaminase
MDYQQILQEIVHKIQPMIGRGKKADCIAPLAEVSSEKFGMAIQTIAGDLIQIGDADEKFSIQSISKLFSLTLAYRFAGASTWNRIGREASGSAFNSLVQLEYEKGIPRNPFINAGALVVFDVILSHTKSPRETFLEFVRELTGNAGLSFSKTIQTAERTTGHRNKALANLLKDFGNLHNSVDEVLDFYFFQCAMLMSCVDLTACCLYLANGGVSPVMGSVVTQRQAKRINAIMLTCGTYDSAGDFAYRVGLPGKSGVGGGIVAVAPGKLSLCVWSPPLNKSGNSYASTKALELFTTKTGYSIF